MMLGSHVQIYEFPKPTRLPKLDWALFEKLKSSDDDDDDDDDDDNGDDGDDDDDDDGSEIDETLEDTEIVGRKEKPFQYFDAEAKKRWFYQERFYSTHRRAGRFVFRKPRRRQGNARMEGLETTPRM
jgi:hypothetical protein